MERQDTLVGPENCDVVHIIGHFVGPMNGFCDGRHILG